MKSILVSSFYKHPLFDVKKFCVIKFMWLLKHIVAQLHCGKQTKGRYSLMKHSKAQQNVSEVSACVAGSLYLSVNVC